MRISNPNNLPLAYVRAVSEQRVPERNRISVTELIKAPQMRALEVECTDEIEVQADDCIDLFFGSAVHEYLAKFAGDTAVAEERLQYETGGWLIHGTPDHVEWLGIENAVLTDWKTTKVRALAYDRPEWAQQVNLYAHLLGLNNMPVHSAVVWAFLKDWDKHQLGSNPEYPRAPVCRIDIPLWDSQRAHEFLMERLALHQDAQDGAYGPCTAEERWQRDSYAVVKSGNSRATRIFDSHTQAKAFVQAAAPPPRRWQDWYEVEERRGEPLRCLSYCRVAEFCGQWKGERMSRLAVIK